MHMGPSVPVAAVGRTRQKSWHLLPSVPPECGWPLLPACPCRGMEHREHDDWTAGASQDTVAPAAHEAPPLPASRNLRLGPCHPSRTWTAAALGSNLSHGDSTWPPLDARHCRQSEPSCRLRLARLASGSGGWFSSELRWVEYFCFPEKGKHHKM